MKIAQTIAGALLGLFFIMVSLMVLLGKAPQPEIPKDTPVWYFMQAFGPTGYMIFVKVCELLSSLLVAIPKTRNFGLLLLGPILVNIVAFHTFVAKDGILNPMIILPIALALFLLWGSRKAFAGLLK